MRATTQLELLAPELSQAVRRAWLALPFRNTRTCSNCGAVGVTTRRERPTSRARARQAVTRWQ
jgi:hypothetical protein